MVLSANQFKSNLFVILSGCKGSLWKYCETLRLRVRVTAVGSKVT